MKEKTKRGGLYTLRSSGLISLLPGAAFLLGASLWLLATVDDSFFRGMSPFRYVLRQGVFGLLALALAWIVGHFSLHRPLLRHWYLFPVFLILIIIYAPISAAAGMGRFCNGYGWWTRSAGVSTFLLALIFSSSFILPRFARGERGGGRAFAILITLLIVATQFFLNRVCMTLVGLAVLAFACSAVLPPKKLAFVLAGLFAGLLCALLLRRAVAPTFLQRSFNLSLESDEHFQLLRSFISVHSGGLLGCSTHPVWIPEWHTDFMFARLCGAGGLVAGTAALFVIGGLFVPAWRIAGRQDDPRARVLAAGCAGALTVPTLIHVAVNLGLLPTLASTFLFLSYAPNLLLFNGLLLGLLLSLSREPAVAAEGSSDSNGTARQPRWPMTIIPLLVCSLLALFVLRIGFLVYASPRLQEHRQRQMDRTKESSEKKTVSIRGRILDVNGRVLAQQSERHYVCADPLFLADSTDRHLYGDLLQVIGLDAETFERRTSDTTRRYVRLAIVTKAAIETVKRMGLRGIFIDTQPSRDYPAETPLAHLAGFVVWEELRGGGGVELIRNKDLENGQDVRLTIDIDLQSSVQGIAETAAADTKAKQVQIIIMNPKTGAIRAAAQVPAAHGGNSAKADPFSLNWRAVMDLFEPGGLMMPLVVASALEAGVLTKGARIDCENGAWEYCGFSLRDAAPFGELSADEILSRSSNIGMAKTGIQMGKQPLYDSLIKWGLSEKCSAGGFGGAPAGLLYPPARWSELEITRIPIGHACAFSLLQIMRAYTAFFNGGQIVEPYLIESDKPVQLRPVLNPEAAVAVRGMLVKVVEEGTGQSARIEGVPVFGKTSIVQKLTPDNRGYSTDKVQTAFIGGFEKEGIPVLIAVWLDEPERKAGFNPATRIFKEGSSVWIEQVNKKENR